ncbi:MAG TPA: D-alanyl-D-alanine carboxypeptidase family protein [Acidimicrobiales bacterium]|nr:D-alanyl-D-alanine carboxypeptidase family protein [Acidimicrobiales bacterium]
MNATLEQAIKNLIAASGGRVWIVSGDRSPTEQKRLWANAVKKYGEKGARKWVAPPGKSNHEKGAAVDLGGDIALAARLAPSFGLHRPMTWEPWHFEVAGAKSDPQAHTHGPNGETVTPPAQTQEPQEPDKPDYGAVLHSMLGMAPKDHFYSPAAWSYEHPEVAGMEPGPRNTALPNPPDDSQIATSPKGGPNGIDAFMAAIRDKESGGNYKAVGVPTPKWGRASGGYQFIDATWGNYKGFARAADAPPEVQDAKARELMQAYYAKFGNWADVAAAWFAGPNGKFASPQVRKYVADALARMKARSQKGAA